MGFTADHGSGKMHTFWFHLKGRWHLRSRRLQQHTAPGMVTYLPAKTPFNLTADEDSLVLKIEIEPQSYANALVGYLRSSVAEAPLSAAKAWGMTDTLSLQGINLFAQALNALKTQLDSTKVESVVDSLAASRPARIKTPPPMVSENVNSGPLYGESQWEFAGVSRRNDDVYIVTYPRSGTTWLQMILYQILTDGDLDRIEHIYEFAPYLGFEIKRLANDLRIEKMPSPRVIKTHRPLTSIYTQLGKYIYVARGGLDVAVSNYFHHLEMGKGAIPFDVFFDRFLSEGRWFEHIKDCRRLRGTANVLFLEYCDLKRNLPINIDRIAAFCGVTLTAEKRARAIDRSSVEYMKQWQHKFHHQDAAYWLHRRRTGHNFIRNGKIGADRELFSSDEIDRFRRIYRGKLGDAELELEQ